MQQNLSNKSFDLRTNKVIINRPNNVKTIEIVPRSWKGVAIKKIKKMLANPINFKIIDQTLKEIFFDIFIKKTP